MRINDLDANVTISSQFAYTSAPDTRVTMRGIGRRIEKIRQVGDMKSLIARTAFALIFCVAAVGGAQAETKLNGKQLRALFPGTFKGTVHGIVDVTLVASRSGKLRGKVLGKKDTGRWKIKGNKLCIKLADMTDGKYKCSFVWRNDKWLVASHGGSIKFRKL